MSYLSLQTYVLPKIGENPSEDKCLSPLMPAFYLSAKFSESTEHVVSKTKGKYLINKEYFTSVERRPEILYH